MKLSIKIWLLAIVYQTIIFALIRDAFAEYIIIIIPIELVGGLPGLFLFDVTTKYIGKSKDQIELKWIWITNTAALSAFITTAITASFFGELVKEFFLGNHFILWYAPIAALLALFSLSIPTHNFLKKNSVQPEIDNQC